MLELSEALPWIGEFPNFIEYLAAMILPPKEGESRSPERLRAHYEVERSLAEKLRRSRSFEERRAICATMYDELFRHVPDHPRFGAKGVNTELRQRDVDWNMAQLRPYLETGCTFLEIGAGDCALSARVAGTASRVYAVDIYFDAAVATLAPNVRQVLSDGRSIDVPEASVDLAFSDQLMEHLHPDDALEQLRNIRRALKPGGIYVCITPNRMYGPTDISGYFSEKAEGFHLREYTLGEIREVFAEAGFTVPHVYVGARGLFVRAPAGPVCALEQALGKLPYAMRRRLADTKPVRALLGLRVAAKKPEAA